MAVLTQSGYDEDLGAFLGFMAGHRGGPVGLGDLAALRLADFRSWLAWRHQQDYARTSTARAMAAVRGFFRYLDRRHGVHNPALQAMRTPRLPHRVPRPLAESDARDLILTARTEARQPWLGLRDTALLLLLYGAGLRIGEALSLNRRAIGVDPRALRSLRVRGKGDKERLVPVLPIVAEALAAYLAACPAPPLPDEPLFKGARGGRLQQGGGAEAGAPAAGRPGPARDRDARTPCATASPPTCWARVPICARSRSCWATPACRRRRATPRSTPAA